MVARDSCEFNVDSGTDLSGPMQTHAPVLMHIYCTGTLIILPFKLLKNLYGFIKGNNNNNILGCFIGSRMKRLGEINSYTEMCICQDI